MTSIRKTLIFSIVGGLLLLTVISGFLGFFWARHSLTHQFDTILAAKARAIANLVEDEEGEIHFEFSDGNMPEFLSEKSDHFFQVWSPDGSVLARSKSLAGQNLPQQWGSPKDPEASVTELRSGVNVRTVGFQFDPIQEKNEVRFVGPSKGGKAAIAVARDTTDLEAILAKVLLIIVSCVLLLPAASAVVVSIAVSRGLRPLGALAGRVAEISASSLKTHINDGEGVVELQPITARLNDLLARLDIAFDRERRFAMDASHELRTPLAESRTALEIALKWPEDQQLLLGSANHALDATYQMEAMVAALLSLARAESGSADGPVESIDLPDVVRHCFDHVRDLITKKNLELSMSEWDVINISTNKPLATAIITNLVSNAVQYAPVMSTIQCDIIQKVDENRVGLRVINSMAVPLSDDDLDKLFEPLWRKDKSRTGDEVTPEVHFGLGLALVKAYCEKLGVPVHVSLSGQMFIIELSFSGTCRLSKRRAS